MPNYLTKRRAAKRPPVWHDPKKGDLPDAGVSVVALCEHQDDDGREVCTSACKLIADIEMVEEEKRAAIAPCPFCGGKADHQFGMGAHWVSCSVCGSGGMFAGTQQKALEFWNTRRCHPEAKTTMPEKGWRDPAVETPEYGLHVMVRFSDRYVSRNVCIGYLDEVDGWTTNDNDELKDVTGWMLIDEAAEILDKAARGEVRHG